MIVPFFKFTWIRLLRGQTAHSKADQNLAINKQTNKQMHLDVVDVERVLLVLAGQNHKDWLRAGPPQVDELHRKVA